MSQINFRKIFAIGYSAISKLIIHFPVEQKTFTKDLRFTLAHTAKKLFPKKNISELSHITGLLRGQIDDALDSEHPISVMDIESLILNDLWNYRDKDDLILINGKSEFTFYSITMDKLKGKHSVSSVMESLIEAGAVKKQGEHLKIISSSFQINHDKGRMINETAVVMDNLVDTMVHNMHAENSKVMYQSTFTSGRIPPSKSDEFDAELYAVAVESMKNLKRVFEKFEVDVPDDHYPARGISVFQFAKNQPKGKTHE